MTTLPDLDRLHAEAAAKAAARKYMSGPPTDESTRIMGELMAEERAAGYDIPHDELRDLWAFTLGYLYSIRLVTDAARAKMEEQDG